MLIVLKYRKVDLDSWNYRRNFVGLNEYILLILIFIVQ